MKRTFLNSTALIAILILSSGSARANPGADHFQLMDVFQLEYASDPADLTRRNQHRVRQSFHGCHERPPALELVDHQLGRGDHRPLTTGNENHGSPRWSPDGKRLLYISSEDGSTQVYCRWMDTGQTAKLTNLTHSPRGIAWSPDGKYIAFSMLVPGTSKPFARMPPKPEGAEWAEPPKSSRKLTYRADGAGYLREGFGQIFILSAEGGTPRQITTGEFNHGGSPEWSPDGKSLIFSANRHPDWEYDRQNLRSTRSPCPTGRSKP